MAVLSAIFKAVDQMSATFDRMGDAGEQALDRWERSANTADGALGKAADSAEGFAQSAQTATSATDNWTDAVGNYDKGALEAIYSTEELVDMGFKTEDALGGAADAADNAADQIERVGKESEEAGEKGKKFGKQSTDAVRTLEGALTSAGVIVALKKIGEGFMEASDAAAAYETQLAKVSTIADTTQASIGTISSEITALSMDTGKSVEGLSDAAYQALSAGVNTANSVSFAGTATKLAVGGFTEAATAVDVLTTALNAYNLKTDDAGKIADMLVTTQNLGKTTVDELATSVGKVIPLASAYGVEMDNLSTAYAVMTANGIATAESTTYIKAMLNELGTSSSTVATALKDQTGKSFAELTDEGYSLGDVLGILGDSVNGNTTAFNEMWSSTEAGVGALSLYNSGAERYNTVLGQMRESTGATASAYDKMMDTTAAANEKMDNSLHNLGVAFGSDLNPTIEKIYTAISKAADGLTNFINKHPAASAFITALTVGLGVVVIAIVAYNAAIGIASVATAAFGAIASTALWPITLIVAGVAALAAGIAVLVNIFGDANKEFNDLTATSKQQYEQLEDLNAQYDEAVELYGENSEQAQALAEDIAGLETEYEACKGTIEDFIAENDALVESHDNLMESYNSTVGQLDQEEKGTMALVGKLEQLASKTNLSAGEQRQMAAIVDKLNSDMPSLGLTYDKVTGSINKNAASVRALAQAKAEEKRQQETYDAYVDLLADQADLQEQLAKATEQTAAAQERYDNASGWDRLWNVGKVKSDLEDFTAEQERLQDALDETNGLIEEHEEAFDAAAEGAENASVAADDYETAVNNAVASVSEDIDTLAAAWDDAYKAARDSIDSTIGLFDTMKTETELSVSDMTAALQSQVDYLTTYSDNLRKAAQYGLDDGLIASLSDGSAESAGYLDAIIGKIETLGGTTEGMSQDAASFVQTFNGQFAEVSQAKDEFASTVATMETDFDASLTDIEGRMDEAITNMNLSTDAAAAANATIDSYISAIQSKTGEAKSAAAAVAAAAQSALSGGSSTTVPGYATGTTNAPNMYIAGEDGPELIVGAAGSTVFPAEETERILGAAGNPIQTSVPAPLETDAQSAGGYSERKITIELAGRGSIELTGGSGNVEEAAAWLEGNLRPVLIGILKKEMQEEGDGSYDY